MAASFTNAIRDEIRRLSRQEIKRALPQTIAAHNKLRKTVAELKRKIKTLETDLKILSRRVPSEQEPVAVSETDFERIRVTGKNVRMLRRKLRLSGAAFGELLKVSAVTVYNWEKKDGPIRMRKASRASFLAARKLGKRDVKKRLAAAD